ncbi:hypothetical protein GT354_37765, partial [Streptomyces sp. SID3343]|nr:hypothetical protein [Streptomyces sp. SID3343]
AVEPAGPAKTTEAPATAAETPGETVSASTAKKPGKAGEQAGAGHVVESGPDAGHTRIS